MADRARGSHRQGSYRQGASRLVRGSVGVAVAALVLVACSAEQDGGSATDPTDPAESSESSEPSESSAVAEDLPTIDPPSWDVAEACRQEAVLEGAQPYPGSVAQMQGFMLIEAVEFPDTEEALLGRYLPIGLERPRAAPADAGTWSAVNALICVDIVEDSEYVRLECEGTADDGGHATWEIWGAELQIRILDPSTGELVAEDEPFDTAELLPGLPCGSPPFELAAGEHGYKTDQPPGSSVAVFVDDYLQTLD